MDDAGVETRTRGTVRRFESASEADRADLAYWRLVPEAERILEVWRLSQEQWAHVASRSDEPGLPRPAASVRRR